MRRTNEQFWDLLKPEHFRARAYCRKLIGNREDGDDLYQDALVAALDSFGRMKDTDAFRPWLYRIIINRFRNRVRSPWYRRLTSLTGDAEVEDNSISPDVQDSVRRHLRIALSALAPFDRALVVLHSLQGWSLEELSALTGKSRGSLKVRLSRARGRMRRALIDHLRKAPTELKHWNPGSEKKLCVVFKPGKD